MSHRKGVQIAYVGSRHGRKLSVRIIRRRDFDDVSRHDVEAVQTPQNLAQLAC